MQIKKKKSDKGRTTKTSEEEEEEFYDCVLASVRDMTKAAAEDGRLCYSPAFGSILVSIHCLHQVIPIVVVSAAAAASIVVVVITLYTVKSQILSVFFSFLKKQSKLVTF